eukprot:jgi/Ulvmu1/5174/UM021_0191.1
MMEACNGSSFERRLSKICGSITEVEQRCWLAEARAEEADSKAIAAEAEAQHIHARFDQAQLALEHALPELKRVQRQNLELTQQIEGFQQQLAQYHDSLAEMTALGGLVTRQQEENAHLHTSLTTVKIERDSALTDLATAYSDMHSMQAALLDSALYVRFLRTQLLEMQLTESMTKTGPTSQQNARQEPHAFTLQKTKQAIQSALQEAALLDPPERAKRINMLRLRWHPDKNCELAEFCGEVTKIINEEIHNYTSHSEH